MLTVTLRATMVLNYLGKRDSIISKLHQTGCNTYFYCPKEDPYHRVRWKDDYPIDWIKDFKKFKSMQIVLELISSLAFLQAHLWS